MLRELTDTKLMKLGIRAIDWQDAIRQAAHAHL